MGTQRAGLRKGLLYAALAGVILAGVVAASARAATVVIRAGNLTLAISVSPSPKTLPRKKLAPFGFSASGKVETTDGTHPSALREAVVEDKNATVNAKGVPVCSGAQLQARDTRSAKRVCGKAIVGRGSAHAAVAFPEQRSIKIASPLLLFNGGTKHGRTTIYIHAFLTVPVPAAVVTTIVVKRLHGGVHAVAKVPVIAGGSGSALDFRFTFERKKFTYGRHQHTYLEARCPDGYFPARLPRLVFKNEAKIEGVAPETVLSGGLSVPCTPRD